MRNDVGALDTDGSLREGGRERKTLRAFGRNQRRAVVKGRSRNRKTVLSVARVSKRVACNRAIVRGEGKREGGEDRQDNTARK